MKDYLFAGLLSTVKTINGIRARDGAFLLILTQIDINSQIHEKDPRV